MKISQDLRIALRAACNCNNERVGYEEKYRMEKEAIFTLFKNKPALGRKFRQHQQNYEKGKKLQDEATSWFEQIGLNYGGDRIRSAAAFESVGGKLNQATPISYDCLISQLVRADNQLGAAILKKHGIKWE